MTSTKSPSPVAVQRNEYGALNPRAHLTADQHVQLNALLSSATRDGQVPTPYSTGNKREFECLNLDIYDVLLFRQRVKGIVVQARTFWKQLRKGYTRSSKTYYLLLRTGRKVSVRELDNATCAKRAKNAERLGQLIGHYLGTKPVACKSPRARVDIGYKVLARDGEGRLLSVFDGSEYRTEEWRREVAREGHGGGFYYYADRQSAEDAARAGSIFAAIWSSGKQLVLCEVEVAGGRVEYSHGKLAASRLRVRQVLTEIPADHDSEQMA